MPAVTKKSDAARQRAYAGSSVFSFDTRQLGVWQRGIVLSLAVACLVGFLVTIQRSLISCREHAVYDPDVCVVPISLLFLSKNQPGLPSEALNRTTSSSSLAVRAQTVPTRTLPTTTLPTTSARTTTTTTTTTTVPPTTSLPPATTLPPTTTVSPTSEPSLNATNEPLAEDLPPVPVRKALTYYGFTTPYFFVAALAVGSTFLFVFSGLLMIGYILTSRKKRPPKISKHTMWMHLIWLSISNLIRLFALCIVGQLSLLVPDMYVSRLLLTPFVYVLPAFPISCLCFRSAVQAALAWYQDRQSKRTNTASDGDGIELMVEEVDGQMQMSSRTKAQDPHVASTHRAETSQIIAKWCIMGTIGGLFLLSVRAGDDYLNYEPAFPYVFGAFTCMIAGALWAFADALLEVVCEVTKSQLDSPRKRFGALLVSVIIQSFFFAVWAFLFLLAIYSPQIRVHGLNYQPDVVGVDDAAALHGSRGMIVVAALSAAVWFMQMVTYKYVHGIAWIFVLHAGLWGLIVSSQRSWLPPISVCITIVCSLALWIIFNLLHALMSGGSEIIKHVGSYGFDRLNATEMEDFDSDQDRSPYESDDFDTYQAPPSKRQAQQAESARTNMAAAAAMSGDETSDVPGDENTPMGGNLLKSSKNSRR